MDIFWYALTGLLLAGYLALESSNFGIGMLFPLARTEPDRARLWRGVVPLFLAHEVWLVAFVGLLFGALPLLEGELLYGMRTPLVLLLCAWFLRDAALWFRPALPGPGWRRGWDVVLPLSSLVLAASWGAVLGALARGLSTDHAGHPVAAPGDLLHPLPLLSAAVAVAVSLRQGAVLAGLRLPVDSALGARLSTLAGRLHWLVPLLAVLSSGTALGTLGGPVSVAVPGVLAALAVYGSARAHAAGRTAGTLLLGAIPMVALPVTVGLAHGTTVLATRAGEGSLTLSEAIADPATLTLLSVTVLPALIAVVLAQVWIWRVFPPERSPVPAPEPPEPPEAAVGAGPARPAR